MDQWSRSKAYLWTNFFNLPEWNRKSVSAHGFTKVSLLTFHVLVHNVDIIFLSETYLNSETSTDDKNLEIPGYYLLRADHPFSNKNGGICMFYRTNLPLRALNISYLSECITFEISIGNKESLASIASVDLPAKHKTNFKLLN